MSNVRSVSSRIEMLDEASLWIYRLDRGLSSDEKSELREWLSLSEKHRLALIKTGQVWDKAEILSKLGDLFPEQLERKANGFWKYSAIAASVAMLAISVWLVDPRLLGGEESNLSSELVVSNLESLYKTAIGEHTRVSLPDGTALALNTNTIVRVNYSDHQRLLILEQGELHVDVAHDASRPLSVLVGSQVVQAIGTAFSVELQRDSSVNLVVTEGKVLVGERKEAQIAPTAAPIVMPVSSLSVSEGHRVLLGQVDESVEYIEFEEMEVQLSWRDGNLIFRGEPLEEAVQEISRYTSAEFVFLEADLKQVKVAGLFRTGDIEGLLEVLDESFQIESQRVDQRILLSRR